MMPLPGEAEAYASERLHEHDMREARRAACAKDEPVLLPALVGTALVMGPLVGAIHLGQAVGVAAVSKAASLIPGL